MFGKAGTLLNPGAAFSPAMIPGLVLWLAGNKSPMTLNSGNVSQWDDFSGNGNHATQGTATFQPLYVASGIHGLPGMTFDTTDDELSTSVDFSNDELFAQTQKVIFVVLKTNASSITNRRLFVGVKGGSSSVGLFIGVGNLAQYHYRSNVPANANFNLGAMTTSTNYIAALRIDGALVKGYLNSLTAGDTKSDGITTAETSLSGADIGGSTGGSGSGATICEIIVQNGVALSDDDFALVMNHLAHKYGITLT